jgi:hypothetical protein
LLAERRISTERLGGRGRSRLKWLKKRAGQIERNCRAAARYIGRNRDAFKSLAEKSALRQIIADGAIRVVVACLGIGDRYRSTMLGGKPTAFAAAPGRVLGMVNAKDLM